MSTLGFGDAIGNIYFGPGVSATDAQGAPLSVFDGTQRVILTAVSTTSLNYNDIKNKPSLFSGDWNDLANRPVLLQGVPGQSIIGPQGLPGNDGVNGKDGINGQDGLNGRDGAQGIQGLSGADSTVPGPAPLGAPGSVVYLASSGSAAATSNFLITSTNITSSLPLYSNIIAGSGSIIPYGTLTGSPALSFLPLTGGVLSGPLVGTLFSGDGGGLSNLAGANVTGTVSVASRAGTVTSSAQPNINSVGTLTSLGVTGTTTSGSFVGVGSGISSLTGANVTGTVPSATSASTAGTVTTAAQPSITSVGTLTGLTVGGITSSTPFFGGGAGLSGILAANIVGTVSTSATATAVTGNAQPNITSVGTLTSLGVTGATTSGSFVGVGTGLSLLTGANVTGTVPLAVS